MQKTTADSRARMFLIFGCTNAFSVSMMIMMMMWCAPTVVSIVAAPAVFAISASEKKPSNKIDCKLCVDAFGRVVYAHQNQFTCCFTVHILTAAHDAFYYRCRCSPFSKLNFCSLAFF